MAHRKRTLIKKGFRSNSLARVFNIWQRWRVSGVSPSSVIVSSIYGAKIAFNFETVE
jgi:hypothetical protein